MKTRILRISIVVVCLSILTVLPRIVSVTNINMLTEVAFLGLFALSFNMLFGYGGLLSFGHSACFGIGAYAVALLIKSFVGVPLLLALFLGGVAGGLAGLLAGAFCVRLKGGYFALLTMAFNQFFFAIALKWRSLFLPTRLGKSPGERPCEPVLSCSGSRTFVYSCSVVSDNNIFRKCCSGNQGE
jgi:ABC-type branched-subunit amino acid transport system permease subunit